MSAGNENACVKATVLRPPAEGEYRRSPRLAVDGTGTAWLAWIAVAPEGERPVLARVTGHDTPAIEDVRPLSGWAPLVTALDLAPAPRGVLAAWIQGARDRAGGAALWLSLAAGTREGPGPVIDLSGAVGPSRVCLCASGEGFAAAWIERSGGQRRIVHAILDGRGAVSRMAVAIAGDGIIDRPSLAAGTAAGPWLAWQEQTPDGTSRILARRLGADGPPLAPVEHRDGGCAACPAIAADGQGGAWVAWHSDVDVREGPRLVRWIEVARIDEQGVISRPVSPLPGIERHCRGEDQGFEFPQPVLGPGGRLVLLGRGSQGLYRQDVGPDGVGPRQRIDEPGWACRGIPAAAAAADGLLVATRERGGLTVRLLPWETPIIPGLAEDGPSSPSRPPSSSNLGSPAPVRPMLINGRRVLFGDIHQHTAASDGTGTRAEAFHRARFRYGDELAAVADHESFVGKRTPPGEWLEQCAEADAAYVPGEFVTLHAFEWTGGMHPGPGHKVVYPPAGGAPVLSRDDPATSGSTGLLAACRGVGAIAVPHHVGWTGADMKAHDPLVQPVWEIVSAHGAYERSGVGPIGTRGCDKPGQFAAEALDAGLRFGFVGGSDGHGLAWHHGVCRREDSHRAGLTAVFAEPTRESVIEALRRRRCYATSGAKIGLWFEVAGRPMGSEITVTGTVRFRVLVRATAPIAGVMLVGNGGRERALSHGRMSADCAGDLPAPRRWACHYVRVEQRDGEVAWSSPVWLDRERG